MILVASAAGAGLAAVYNVPLAGALFAIEILLARFSAGAAVSPSVDERDRDGRRPSAGRRRLLYHVDAVAVTPSLLVAAVLVGPLMGWGRRASRRHRPPVAAAAHRVEADRPARDVRRGRRARRVLPLILGNGRPWRRPASTTPSRRCC
jgi:CIC family chloride channel protein